VEVRPRRVHGAGTPEIWTVTTSELGSHQTLAVMHLVWPGELVSTEIIGHYNGGFWHKPCTVVVTKDVVYEVYWACTRRDVHSDKLAQERDEIKKSIEETEGGQSLSDKQPTHLDHWVQLPCTMRGRQSPVQLGRREATVWFGRFVDKELQLWTRKPTGWTWPARDGEDYTWCAVRGVGDTFELNDAWFGELDQTLCSYPNGAVRFNYGPKDDYQVAQWLVIIPDREQRNVPEHANLSHPPVSWRHWRDVMDELTRSGCEFHGKWADALERLRDAAFARRCFFDPDGVPDMNFRTNMFTRAYARMDRWREAEMQDVEQRRVEGVAIRRLQKGMTDWLRLNEWRVKRPQLAHKLPTALGSGRR